MGVYLRNKNNFILSEVFASAYALSTYFPNNPCTVILVDIHFVSAKTQTW